MLKRWVAALCGAAAVATAMPLMAAELERIDVSVPGPGTAGYMPIELITKIGADRAEGAELKLKFVGGGGIALDHLLTNNADFAVVGLPAAMSARLKDERVVAVAPVNDLPLYALLVRQALKGKVKTISDLKGKTIGVHSNSLASKTNSHQLLELVLSTNGVAPSSVRTVPVTQRWESEAAMLVSGDADAVMGDEPYATRMEAEKTAFTLLHLGDPAQTRNIAGAGFLRATLIARRDQIEKNPQKVERMVRIIKHTLDWIATHTPEEIVQAAGLTDPVESKYFLQVLKKYPRQYSRDGKFSTRQLVETETFFHASQAANPAAKALKLESMVLDRWAGRKE